MFKALGAVLIFYAVHVALTGRAYAKSGYKGRAISRQDEPRYFRVVAGIHAALAIALITVF